MIGTAVFPLSAVPAWERDRHRLANAVRQTSSRDRRADMLLRDGSIQLQDDHVSERRLTGYNRDVELNHKQVGGCSSC